MKLATTSPVPAGSVMIRDQRAWHGGTPNLSREVRAIPHFGMVCAPWFNTNTQKALPRSLYEELSPEGQHACRYIVADSDEVGPFGNREHPSCWNFSFCLSISRTTMIILYLGIPRVWS